MLVILNHNHNHSCSIIKITANHT